MSIAPLRVGQKQLLARVRDAARSSSNVVFVPPLDRRAMAGMMTFHQALKCLQEGSFVGRPQRNDNDDWEFRMERHAAKLHFQIKVVAQCEGARVARLIVLLREP